MYICIHRERESRDVTDAVINVHVKESVCSIMCLSNDDGDKNWQRNVKRERWTSIKNMMAISNYPAYFKGTGNDLDFFSSLLLLHFARWLFLFILLCPLYVTVSHSLICSASHSHCSLCVSCVCALCDDLIEKHSTIMLYNDVEGKQAKLPFR